MDNDKTLQLLVITCSVSHDLLHLRSSRSFQGPGRCIENTPRKHGRTSGSLNPRENNQITHTHTHTNNQITHTHTLFLLSLFEATSVNLPVEASRRAVGRPRRAPVQQKELVLSSGRWGRCPLVTERLLLFCFRVFGEQRVEATRISAPKHSDTPNQSDRAGTTVVRPDTSETPERPAAMGPVSERLKSAV